MKIKDIEQYIVEDYGKNAFAYYLPKGSFVVQDAIQVANDKELSISLKDYIQNVYGEDYEMVGATFSGETVTHVKILKTVHDGREYVIKYKGVEFFANCDESNEVKQMELYFKRQGSQDSYMTIDNVATMEEAYQEALFVIRRSKRKTMNHYNKLIKDIKQDYKEELKRHNDILKEDSK